MPQVQKYSKFHVLKSHQSESEINVNFDMNTKHIITQEMSLQPLKTVSSRRKLIFTFRGDLLQRWIPNRIS